MPHDPEAQTQIPWDDSLVQLTHRQDVTFFSAGAIFDDQRPKTKKNDGDLLLAKSQGIPQWYVRQLKCTKGHSRAVPLKGRIAVRLIVE